MPKTKTRPARREDLPAFFTVQEAAELLRVSTRTLRRWRSLGRIEFHYTTAGRGGKARISADAMQRLISEMAGRSAREE